MLSTTQETTAKIWTQNNLKAVYQTGARHTDSSQHSNIQTSQHPTSLIKTTATSNFCLVLRHPNVNTKATVISMQRYKNSTYYKQ